MKKQDWNFTFWKLHPQMLEVYFSFIAINVLISMFFFGFDPFMNMFAVLWTDYFFCKDQKSLLDHFGVEYDDNEY